MNGLMIAGIVAVVVVVVAVVVLTRKGKTPSSPNPTVSSPSGSLPVASSQTTSSSTSSGTETSQENWLVGVSGDIAGKNFHVGNQTITIGRAASNFIQITDSDASRIHCRILPVSGSLQVQDMDSSNGIFVNDKKVKRHIFQDQDVLRIGECRFVYHRLGQFQQTTTHSKSVSTEILRPTVRFDGEVMTELIVKALQESKGDIAKVADATNLPPEKIEEIGKKYGVL